MKLSTAIAISMASCPLLSIAQTERDLGSHEHGAATLNVAIDGNSVFLELESPWNNLVGFEHAPRTDEQHAMVDDALGLINQPDQLFSFVGSECSVTETMLESGISEEHDHDEGHEEGHDKDHDDGHEEDHDKDHDDGHEEGHDKDHDDGHEEGHDKDHDDGHEEGHDKDHDEDHEEGHDKEHDDDGHKDDHDDHDAHDEEGEDTHSSLLVSYAFDCTEASKLTAIDVTLLDVWSGFEDLDVQLIGPGGQALVELNQQQGRVDLTPVQ